MCYAISDFAVDTFGFGGATKRDTDQFMAFWVGENVVKHDIYTFSAGKVQKNGVNTAYTSMFDLYKDQITAGHNCVLTITNPAGNNPHWWWTGGEFGRGGTIANGEFHTLAGRDSTRPAARSTSPTRTIAAREQRRRTGDSPTPPTPSSPSARVTTMRREQALGWFAEDEPDLPRPLAELEQELDENLEAWQELGARLCRAFLSNAGTTA